MKYKWLILIYFSVVCFYQSSILAQTNQQNMAAAKEEQLVAEIKGSMCPACLKKLENKIAKRPGVTKVFIESRWDIRVPENIRLNLKTNHAILHVSFNAKEISTENLLEIIKISGFEIYELKEAPSSVKKETSMDINPKL